MEGNQLNCMNLKGTLGDMPVCDDTSSNRSWAVSSGSPPWNISVREVSLCIPPPVFVAFFYLPIFKTEVLFIYDPRIYANPTKNLDIALGAKTYQSFFKK